MMRNPKSEKATRESWKNKPFINPVPISYDAVFNTTQFELLKQGLIPRQMEDKWFCFYETDSLFLHRSWTGLAVYRVDFVVLSTSRRVNKAYYDLPEGRPLDETYQPRLLDFLIRNLLLGEKLHFPRPEGSSESDGGLLQHHISGTGFSEEKK